jgi:general secretion pathway protein G
MWRLAQIVAFTLVEMLLVIALLTTLAAIVTPNYLRVLEEAKEERAKAEIMGLQTKITDFLQEHGDYPQSLEELPGGVPIDPWGNPYEYLYINYMGSGHGQAGFPQGVRKDKFLVPLNTDYDLYSRGADGITAAPLTAKASHDDIIRADNGGYFGLASGF